jgi:hypothetical protein
MLKAVVFWTQHKDVVLEKPLPSQFRSGSQIGIEGLRLE